MPVFDLATQRRMRPDIADLIRPAVYPNLQDAPQVESYPSVKGMLHNLFFWDHAMMEDASGTIASSKTNRCVLCLCRVLCKYMFFVYVLFVRLLSAFFVNRILCTFFMPECCLAVFCYSFA